MLAPIVPKGHAASVDWSSQPCAGSTKSARESLEPRQATSRACPCDRMPLARQT